MITKPKIEKVMLSEWQAIVTHCEGGRTEEVCTLACSVDLTPMIMVVRRVARAERQTIKPETN